MKKADADLELAVEAARAAGVVVMRAFRSEQHVVFKSPDQPLTEADLAADAVLKQILLKKRPSYGWLSEETADTPERLERESVWIVDPIDGTHSFIAGRPEFAISIGLAKRGAIMLGVIYNPASGELFSAQRGKGAFLNGSQLSMEPAGGRAVMAASRSELQAGEFDSFGDDFEILPSGSTAYKLARVAQGAAHIFLSRGPKSEWDVCAGVLLVEEAGGRVTDLRGNELRYNRPRPDVYGVLAASNALHRQLLERIATLPPPARLLG